ncbi:hypothetical protein ACCO45_013354 [Purpureocillium lilacinum]|uniref:Uncharacterized protein n=1 Tax=Purpureocillium lilacinum TaxID=33203 RepID=A0ACC4DD62_PURLI
MTRLYYHDGHYHPESRLGDRRRESRDRQGQPDGNLWHKTYQIWDQVLYGVGSFYYKIRGR